MQTFEVILRQRLTEIDAIITQLVQRDVFSMYSQLFLLTSNPDARMAKRIIPSTTSEIDAKMMNFLKTVYETLHNQMYLDLDIDLSSSITVSGETLMEILSEELSVTSYDIASGNSVLNILTAPLESHTAHSIGNVGIDLIISSEQIDTTKYAFHSYNEELQLGIFESLSATKKIELDGCILHLSSSLFNVYYLKFVDGNSNLIITTSAIDHYILKKILYGLDPHMVLSLTAEYCARKSISVDNTLYLIAEVEGVLVKIAHPNEACTEMTCEASIELLRYRRLDEMDDLTLDDFDNMTLYETDYVTVSS